MIWIIFCLANGLATGLILSEAFVLKKTALLTWLPIFFQDCQHDNFVYDSTCRKVPL
jgi:hypothetical protein